MVVDQKPDYYEILQISQNAEPDTIGRVFRLFAQRFHPDNQESGDAGKFRLIHEAYSVLNDPVARAKYDIGYQQQRQERWRLVSSRTPDNQFDLESSTRLTVLEVLYTQRRIEPGTSGVYQSELEKLAGRTREHLEFTVWYLSQKGLIVRSDSSRLNITADGVDYLEKHYQNAPKRLTEQRMRA